MKIDLIEADAPLTLQTRAALALNSTHTERDLVALASKNTHIVAVIDKPGREQAHGAAMELKRARTTIEKVSKAAREDATQFQKAIIAEEKRLISLVEPEETRLLGLRDQFDQEQERIKREAEAKERARITAIHERIAEIRSFSMLAGQCRTAARVAELLSKLKAFDLNGFEEFSEEAATVHAATVSGVTFIHDEKVSEEVERARVKAEQEAAAAALAAERAALEKEKAELAAARQAIEDAKPKAAPVDEYEQELQAFAAVLAPEPAPVVPAHPVVIDGPLVMSSALRDQFEKTYAYCDEAWNPSDVQILDALCQHFNKSERLVYERLARGFDLAALNAATFDDVPV